jgi:hypothetical protein
MEWNAGCATHGTVGQAWLIVARFGVSGIAGTARHRWRRWLGSATQARPVRQISARRGKAPQGGHGSETDATLLMARRATLGIPTLGRIAAGLRVAGYLLRRRRLAGRRPAYLPDHF